MTDPPERDAAAFDFGPVDIVLSHGTPLGTFKLTGSLSLVPPVFVLRRNTAARPDAELEFLISQIT